MRKPNIELAVRILPVIAAFALAVPGAAWAQSTWQTGLNGANPGIASPGTPPLIGGESAGITPGATPPAIGNTAIGGGMAPDAPLSLNGGPPGLGNQLQQPGANSFTREQVVARIQKQGFTNVTGLHKDDQGIWHGKAMRNGRPAAVTLDYRGHVVGAQDDAAGHQAGRFYQGEAR